MCWKNIVMMAAIVVAIVAIIISFIKCMSNPAGQSIVIHDGVDLSGLNDRIEKAFIAHSAINRLISPLPLTHEFSHWMVLLKTNTNKFYLISTSPKQCVEVINTNYNEYVKRVMYQYQDYRDFYVKIKGYDVKNVNMSVFDYCNQLLKHYICEGTYRFFSNNCHAMTEYGLMKILKITEAENELKRSYDVLHVAKDIWNSKSVLPT